MKKSVVIILIFLLAISAGLFYVFKSNPLALTRLQSLFYSDEKVSNPQQAMISTEREISSCQVDEDCLTVPYNHCCGTTEKAINKHFLDEYLKHPEWQKFDDAEVCSVIGQCTPTPAEAKPRCVETPSGKQCVLR